MPSMKQAVMLLEIITNVVELTGALADNNYYLDTSQDYIAASEFVVANISFRNH